MALAYNDVHDLAWHDDDLAHRLALQVLGDVGLRQRLSRTSASATSRGTETLPRTLLFTW